MLSDSKDFLSDLQNILHKETQLHEKNVDLTISKVFALKNKGKLDFGGSEFNKSDLKEIYPEKKSEEDKYGWWNLNQGVYLVEFNEELKKGFGIVQSINRLIQTGSFIPMRIVEGNNKIKSLLFVGDNGVDIKENARAAGLFKIT